MIPEHASIAFKGIIYDVLQWEQELFDGTTATFEALKGKDIAKVIAEANGRIAICHEQQPNTKIRPTLPGGYVEGGETLSEGAARELLEETGFASESWHHFKSYKLPYKIDNNYGLFIARNCIKVQEPELDKGSEKITLELVTFEDFFDMAISRKLLLASDFIIDLLILERNSELEQFRQQILG